LSIDELEVLVRALGLPYQKRENAILTSYKTETGEEIGIVISLEQETESVRVAAPLDVEPLPQALSWFLEENFTSTTYKYTIDTEGFITVVYDLPAKCIRTARDLREAIVEVIEGAKKVLERVEKEES